MSEETPVTVAESGGASVSDQQSVAAATVVKPEEPRPKFNLKPPKVH